MPVPDDPKRTVPTDPRSPRPPRTGSDAVGPTVSIIIPCYRQAVYLPDAVGCVLAQTIGDWECLIVNDGSPDDTPDVAQRLMTDPRIRYLEHPNRGVSYTRNRGLEECSGRYVQFLDADDLLTPDKLEIQLAALSDIEDVALAYCDYRYCSPDGTVLNDHPWYRSPRLTPGRELPDLATRWESDLGIAIHSFLFDARIFRQHGVRFDESLPANEDWDCWMQVFSLHPTVRYVDRPCALYRLHHDARTRNASLLRTGFLAALRKQRLIFRDDPEMTALLVRKTSQVRRVYRSASPWRRTVRALTAKPIGWLRKVLPAGVQSGLRRLRDALLGTP